MEILSPENRVSRPNRTDCIQTLEINDACQNIEHLQYRQIEKYISISMAILACAAIHNSIRDHADIDIAILCLYAIRIAILRRDAIEYWYLVVQYIAKPMF